MNKIQFSVLSYYPSVATTENISVGILFHNLSTDERFFHSMKKWSRLESFDDTLDVEFIKIYLKSISAECENNLLNEGNEFSISEYIRHYVNELKFGEVKEVKVDNADDFISSTVKVLMKLDFEKKERLSNENEVRYIKMLLNSKKINYSVKSIQGGYAEDVKFDYCVGKFAFKFFNFESKNLKKQIMNAKAWSFTAQKLCDEYKPIFVYDVDRNGEDDYQIIMKILKENAFKVIPTSEAVDFVMGIQNDPEQHIKLRFSM